jgi:acyl-CoA reductase-like NAD-dependent aldehyde dehydrogenase
MPWNYPFWQFFRFAATTLMAGNTILLKHSSDVPACAQQIDKIFQEACVPGGVFQNLMVRSDKIENIVKDFRVQAASLTGVRQGMPAYREELFGPVASVMVASDGVEAVRIANDSDYGLGASIWTGDLERGWKMSREVQAGIIYINDEVHSRPELPFGGVKKSGIGREMAAAGSREFTNRKSIWYDVNKQ